MRGDRIEIRRPLTNDPPWDLVEVISAHLDSYHRVLLKGPDYVVPRLLGKSRNWRWPHLTTLGIRGSFCCEEHGIIEPTGPLTNGPPVAGFLAGSGAIGTLDDKAK